MRAALAFFLAVFGSSLTLALFAACDDTPRGEQGIDYLGDGGYYTVPPGREAGADVVVPCVEEKDPTGVCAQAASDNGTPATHFIVCVTGQEPVEIVCVGAGSAGMPADAAGAADASTADGGSFCCTTGLI
jgi:hypothetical protein